MKLYARLIFNALQILLIDWIIIQTQSWIQMEKVIITTDEKEIVKKDR